MLPLVAVSGCDCVDALHQAGYVTVSRTDSAITVRRGDRVVVVSDCAMVTPGDLQALLRDAGISYGAFLDLLSESPTDPDVLRTCSGVRTKSTAA